MKLRVLVNNRELLKKIAEMQVSGKIAFQLRKTINKYYEELTTFDVLKNAFIKKNGSKNKQGNYEIIPGTKQFIDVIAYLNEITEANISKIDPVLKETDLESIELSVKELNGFYDLGFVKVEKPKKKSKK